MATVKVFLFLAFYLGVTKALPSVYNLLDDLDADPKELFEEFIKVHNKKYADENEKLKRFEIFEKELKKYQELNENPNEMATFGINQFSDLTEDEFSTMYLGLNLDADSGEATNSTRCPLDNFIGVDITPPEEWDWRKQGVVSPVKDQAQCGSCWAFSAVGNLEGQYAKKHKKLLQFSEQQLVDCDSQDYGCDGGVPFHAFQYWEEKGGAIPEDKYPYVAENQRCKADPSLAVAKVNGFCPYPLGQDEEKLKNILYTVGPLSMCLVGRGLKSYSSGIYSNYLECQGRLSHAVLLVGYGVENNTKFWTFKNSWGASFGEEGYFRLLRGVNCCNIMNDNISSVKERTVRLWIK